MKIIAITKESQFGNNYLAEIGEKEIKQILGNYSSDKKLYIGQEIEVSEIYDKYKSITANKKRLKEIRDEASGIIASVEKINPLVAPFAETK